MLTVDIDKNSGFCAGVIRAISKAEEFLNEAKQAGDSERKLFSLGAIVHNDAELTRLVNQGLVTIDKEDLDEMVKADGEVLLIRAHGEPPQTYEKAYSIGFEARAAAKDAFFRIFTSTKTRYCLSAAIRSISPNRQA